MNSEIRKTLEAVKSGELSVDDALLAIKKEPFEDIGYAKVDLHRGIRQGAAEVIYGAGKTPEQMVGIIGAMLEHEVKTILLTRLSEEKAAEIRKTYPQMDYRKDARIGTIGQFPAADGLGKIVVASVIIAIAGMEGALASVIGGLADCPVIAVPTSIGYGASFGGVSALLSMLNSCSSGVSVVNIDNGFGAGYLASMINHMTGAESKK